MHFVLLILLIGGGIWGWRNAESPAYHLIAAIAVALGVIAGLGLSFFYVGLRRDLKK